MAFFFFFFINYYYLTQIKNIGYPRLVGYSTENHKIISLASANYTILTGEVTLVFETLFLIQQPFIQTQLSIIAPISAACIWKAIKRKILCWLNNFLHIPFYK